MPQGSRDPLARIPGIPGLQPGQLALFEIGNDLVCHLGVNIVSHVPFPLIGLRMQPICPSGEEWGSPSRPKGVRGGAGARREPEPRPGRLCPKGSRS